MQPPAGKPKRIRVPRAERKYETLPIPESFDPLAVLPKAQVRSRGGTRVEKLRATDLNLTPAICAAFALIERELGGRDRVVATLLGADLSATGGNSTGARLQTFLGMLIDPMNDDQSLAVVATLAEISLPILQKTFVEARRARAHLIATDRIAEKTPDLAAQVMDDAMPGERMCPTCFGAAEVAKPTQEDPSALGKCPACAGRGKIYHTPDHAVQKTALKLAGLLSDGRAGVLVQQTNNTLVKGGGDPGVDRVISALDGLLYGHGRDRLVKGPEGPEEDVTADPVVDDPGDSPVQSQL